MGNKVIGKNWDITKISKDFNPVDLLEKWHKAKLSETSLRKTAFKSLENFKKWWFVYLRAESLQMKVRIIYGDFKDSKKITDEQKDFCDEVNRIREEVKKHYEKLSKVSTLMRKNKKKVLSYIASNPELKKYKVKITLDFLNNEGHDISNDVEKTIDATWGVEVLDVIYRALNDDKVHDTIRDDNGAPIKEIKQWSDGYNSRHENIRKKTFISLFSWEQKHRKTLFNIAAYTAARLNQIAHYYKYSSWVEQHVAEELLLDSKDYYYIIDACTKFANAYNDYVSYGNNLIVKYYGLEKYEPWECGLEIKNTKDSITRTEAINLVTEALSCMGPDYTNRVKKLINSDLVKWDNKKSAKGGYCISGTSMIDVHPINLNWNGTSISAGTLAHELGHSIGKNYVKENNEINTDINAIFTEIPSLVNTVIFYQYLIKKMKANNANKNHLYGIYQHYLEYLCENISETGYYLELADRGTREILKGEMNPYTFESSAYHLKRQIFGITNSEYKKNRKQWPNWLITLDCYKQFITYCLNSNVNISYYVGSIIGLVIGNKILNGDKVTLNRYLKFLKTGTTTDPLKTIKDILGIDLLKPQIYTEAKHNLENLIKDFKRDIKI